MRAGQLRHRADFEILSGTTNYGSRGERGQEYTTKIQSIPVSIRQLSGREAELARQNFPTATHEVRSRYFQLGEDVKARWNKDGRHFNIHSFNNVDERNIELVFTCTEERRSYE